MELDQDFNDRAARVLNLLRSGDYESIKPDLKYVKRMQRTRTLYFLIPAMFFFSFCIAIREVLFFLVGEDSVWGDVINYASIFAFVPFIFWVVPWSTRKFEEKHRLSASVVEASESAVRFVDREIRRSQKSL